MAKKVITKKIALKKKKKYWVPILATREFDYMEIGESLVAEPSSLVGKKVVVNFMHLTNDIKKQNTKLHFKVKEVKEDKAYTEIVGLEMVEAYIKRVIKKSREKLDDSMQVITKDEVKVQVKSLIITRNQTKGSILALLRKKAREMLIALAKENTYDAFIDMLLTNELQRKMRDTLKKIYPIAVSEIRILQKLSA